MWGTELITPAEALSRLSAAPQAIVMRPLKGVRTAVLFLLCGGGALAALVAPFYMHNQPLLGGVIAALTLAFFTLILLRDLQLARLPSAWIMAVASGKIYLNYRHYWLGPDNGQPSVLVIAPSDIQRTSVHRGGIATTTKHSSSTLRRYHRFHQLALHLKDALPAELVAQLLPHLAPLGGSDSPAFSDYKVSPLPITFGATSAEIVIEPYGRCTPSFARLIEAVKGFPFLQPMKQRHTRGHCQQLIVKRHGSALSHLLKGHSHV